MKSYESKYSKALLTSFILFLSKNWISSIFWSSLSTTRYNIECKYILRHFCYALFYLLQTKPISIFIFSNLSQYDQYSPFIYTKIYQSFKNYKKVHLNFEHCFVWMDNFIWILILKEIKGDCFVLNSLLINKYIQPILTYFVCSFIIIKNRARGLDKILLNHEKLVKINILFIFPWNKNVSLNLSVIFH